MKADDIDLDAKQIEMMPINSVSPVSIDDKDHNVRDFYSGMHSIQKQINALQKMVQNGSVAIQGNNVDGIEMATIEELDGMLKTMDNHEFMDSTGV